MAKTFNCISLDQKVHVKAEIVNENSGDVEVLSPFQKKMECIVSDFSNGAEIVKGFVCGGNDFELPDLFMVSEKHRKGMIEVSGQAHHDLECEIN